MAGTAGGRASSTVSTSLDHRLPQASSGSRNVVEMQERVLTWNSPRHPALLLVRVTASANAAKASVDILARKRDSIPAPASLVRTNPAVTLSQTGEIFRHHEAYPKQDGTP